MPREESFSLITRDREPAGAPVQLLFAVCVFLTGIDAALSTVALFINAELALRWGGSANVPSWRLPPGLPYTLVWSVALLLIAALFAGVFVWQRRDGGRLRLLLLYVVAWLVGTLPVAWFLWWPLFAPRIY